MRSRFGVSLVECLVALLLLMFGSAGLCTLLLTATRLAQHARLRDQMVGVAARAVARFTATPCASHRDTVWEVAPSDGVRAQWRLAYRDSAGHLSGTVLAVGTPLHVQIARRCP